MSQYTERVQDEVASGELVPSRQPPARSPAEQQERHAQVHLEEQEAADAIRTNLGRAIQIEAELLDKAAEARPHEVAQMLSAVSNSKAKSIDGLLKLTGRQPGEGEGTDIASLLLSMERRGLAKVNVSLEVERES